MNQKLELQQLKAIEKLTHRFDVEKGCEMCIGAFLGNDNIMVYEFELDSDMKKMIFALLQRKQEQLMKTL